LITHDVWNALINFTDANNLPLHHDDLILFGHTLNNAWLQHWKPVTTGTPWSMDAAFPSFTSLGRLSL
jgi:hypothetical protein